MYFEDEYAYYDQLTVSIETSECIKKVRKLSDEKLIDEIVLLQQHYDFSSITDKIIAKYWSDSFLTAKDRKIIEGAMILTNTYLGISEDGDVETLIKEIE